ncbi:MAG TPA: hypothetical protein VK638_05235 [Edaphobacter sp.]|nr:hypothetical protein [Edaphobacter sp.]
MRNLLQIAWRRCPLILVVASTSSCLFAQAGPPFRADDPETPGNGNWEINFGFIGDRNPQAGSYQTPDLDINYGLGTRIQLKYDLPLTIAETRQESGSGTSGSVLAGPGSSLLGMKIRFYEHHEQSAESGQANSGSVERPIDFSISTYPQFTLNNPTRSVARGVVEPGPDFLLPLEMNGKLSPIRLAGEVGYHFGNDALAQSWIRGLLIGHEFNDRLEAYLELYDEQDANRIYSQSGDGSMVRLPKQRETTLGLGGRYGLNRSRSLVLLMMGGRSFQKVSVNNSQPSWIAYVGLQLRLEHMKQKNQ